MTNIGYESVGAKRKWFPGEGNSKVEALQKPTIFFSLAMKRNQMWPLPSFILWVVSLL